MSRIYFLTKHVPHTDNALFDWASVNQAWSVVIFWITTVVTVEKCLKKLSTIPSMF